MADAKKGKLEKRQFTEKACRIGLQSLLHPLRHLFIIKENEARMEKGETPEEGNRAVPYSPVGCV